jgi:hypothetical protein
VAEQAACEELLEFALHEAWIAEPVLRAITRMIEQRREVIMHDAVEHRGLGLAAGVPTCAAIDVGWAASMFAAAERQVP